jgi:uncharacterized protein
MIKFYKLNNRSFASYKVKNYKDLWKKLKAKGYKGISVDSFINVKKSKSVEDGFNVVMSTAKEDRHYEIVYQDFDLKSFKKNPVVLDSHNYDGIEHILGKVKNVKTKDKKLQGTVVFAEMNPKGALAKEMLEAGFINAVSIGFIPKEFDEKYNILKSELLELSIVSVPANPEALFEKINKTYAKNKKGNKKSTKKSGDNVKDKAKDKTKLKANENNDSKGKRIKVKKSKKDEPKPIVPKSEETIKVKSKKVQIMETIAYSIKSVGEELKRNSVDDPTDRAEYKRLVNKSIRGLLKIK